MNATELLDSTPFIRRYADHGLRRGIPMVSPEGVRFMLSVQTGAGAYCTPRTLLPRVTEYDAVEVGIMPRADSETRFLLPVAVGLTYSPRGSEYGDPDAYVPVSELVAALDAFFAAGGTVEP